MSNFNIKIADTIFSIEAKFPYPMKLCENYLIDDSTSDYKIAITDAERYFERKKVERQAKLDGVEPEKYPPGYYEATSIYRKIANYFLDKDALVIHGALISYEGNGYLFIAKSGVGKTTHVENWKKVFPETKIINGDKPIVKIIDEGLQSSPVQVRAYGTPWCGKEGYNENDSVVLKNIIWLERGNENKIEKITSDEILNIVVSQTHKRIDNLHTEKVMKTIIEILKNVSCYHLFCNMEEVSAKVAYKGMN